MKITSREEDEPVKHPVIKKSPTSPPHMMTLPDMAPDEFDTKSAILIRGTQIGQKY